MFLFCFLPSSFICCCLNLFILFYFYFEMHKQCCSSSKRLSSWMEARVLHLSFERDKDFGFKNWNLVCCLFSVLEHMVSISNLIALGMINLIKFIFATIQLLRYNFTWPTAFPISGSLVVVKIFVRDSVIL